jgi:hypothetical protein
MAATQEGKDKAIEKAIEWVAKNNPEITDQDLLDTAKTMMVVGYSAHNDSYAVSINVTHNKVHRIFTVTHNVSTDEVEGYELSR